MVVDSCYCWPCFSVWSCYWYRGVFLILAWRVIHLLLCVFCLEILLFFFSPQSLQTTSRLGRIYPLVNQNGRVAFLLRGVSPLTFSSIWKNTVSLVLQLFSWQDRGVASVYWPAIVRDGYLFCQPAIVCQVPLTDHWLRGHVAKIDICVKYQHVQFLLWLKYEHNLEFLELWMT